MANGDPLLDEIAALLAAAEGGDDPDRLERTLTDGYAKALLIEGERRRADQRIKQLISDAANEDPAGRQELNGLLRLAKRHDGDLSALRDQLGLLRRRYSNAVRAFDA